MAGCFVFTSRVLIVLLGFISLCSKSFTVRFIIFTTGDEAASTHWGFVMREVRDLTVFESAMIFTRTLAQFCCGHAPMTVYRFDHGLGHLPALFSLPCCCCYREMFRPTPAHPLTPPAHSTLLLTYGLAVLTYVRLETNFH